MYISIICVALLGLLCVGLGFNVSLGRARTQTMFEGDVNPEDPLYKARRAHGNTVEYAPILAVMILALGLNPQPAWVTWCMVAAVFFRYLFALGILIPRTMAEPHPMRFIGSLGTYLSGFGLVAALLLSAGNV